MSLRGGATAPTKQSVFRLLRTQLGAHNDIMVIQFSPACYPEPVWLRTGRQG